jgi:hypothetical protein
MAPEVKESGLCLGVKESCPVGIGKPPGNKRRPVPWRCGKVLVKTAGNELPKEMVKWKLPT